MESHKISKDNLLNIFANNGYLFDGNTVFLENLYSEYLKNDSNIADEWRNLFNTLPQVSPDRLVKQDYNIRETSYDADKQVAISRLIDAYRFYGHQVAEIDPLGLSKPPETPELDPAYYGLEESDLEKTFTTGQIWVSDKLTLREILKILNRSYCGTVGTEFMHLKSGIERKWIMQRLENDMPSAQLSAQSCHELLGRLVAAETLEKYLNLKYQGQKRFSLEGAESLIPLLDEIIRKAGRSPVKKVVIGMSHRGRLNVLINIIGKSISMLFREFENKEDIQDKEYSGDVKYHLGFTSNLETPEGSVHISLASNPSHLEFINPVVEGAVRSRQRRLADKTGDLVLPVLIHGDAAFCAEGIVMETLQMTQTQGFTTGGTLHIIVNNQVGFTRSTPIRGSFSGYCTEIGKIAGAPIFHVNADDPEMVLFISALAFDFRKTFKKDAIIDLVAYRRNGHNETDEPRVTQPIMYKTIDAHPTITQKYADLLLHKAVLQKKEELNEIINLYRVALDKEERVAPHLLLNQESRLADKWNVHLNADWQEKVDTKISPENIKELAHWICLYPEGFEMHRTVKKIMDDRNKMSEGSMPLDWGFAEMLAYASLLKEGFDVRISGQDSSRGTFFHRHAILHNQENGQTYSPLQHIPENKSHFIIIDSLLSEAAVLGFEYGYSIGSPESLVIWEAQFGDFANAAQVIIDQFITSGETKWKRSCGLVLFLPHGYDGQGPEHSSGRLERFLNLAAENNIQVCIPTLPSQLFHLLRRQMIRSLRKPLIIMMPKNLLRHNLSVSSLEDLSKGHFKNIIGDIDNADNESVKCIIACSGKIYFELYQARRESGKNEFAIIRFEQLYPFPKSEFQEILKKYPNTNVIRWCQEEPENQGAWNFMQRRFIENIDLHYVLEHIAHPASASPAEGYHKKYEQQHQALIEAALNLKFTSDMTDHAYEVSGRKSSHT